MPFRSSQVSSKMSSVQEMPDELLGRIFLMSDTETKLECRIVCRKWESILDKYLLTSKVFLSNCSMRSALRCHAPIKTLQVRSLTTEKFVPMVESRIGSNFGVGNGGIQELIFSRVLKRKLLTGRVSTENLDCLLHLCASSIKYLFFDFNTLVMNQLNSGGRGLTFSNLSHLKVCIGSTDPERENLRELANGFEFHRLKKLQLFNGFQRDKTAIAELYQSYMKIVQKCGSTLKVLNLVHPLLSYIASEEQNQSIGSEETLFRIEANLEEVYINLDKEEASERRAVLELLQNQSNLKLLHLNFREGSQLGSIGLSDIIAKNSGALEGIDLVGPKRGERLEFFRHLDNSVWAACNSLRSLRIINYVFYDLPLSLPNTLQELILWGVLSNNEAQVMRTIRLKLPNLQRLDYYDIEKSATGNDALQEEVELLVQRSRNLNEMFIYKHNFDTSFLTNMESPKIVLRAMDISSKWCWPLKKIVLKRAYHVAIQR